MCTKFNVKIGNQCLAKPNKNIIYTRNSKKSYLVNNNNNDKDISGMITVL